MSARFLFFRRKRVLITSTLVGISLAVILVGSKDNPPPVSAELAARRDQLLAEADIKICSGLRALAEQYPQVRRGFKEWDGMSEKIRAEVSSSPGRLGVYLRDGLSPFGTFPALQGGNYTYPPGSFTVQIRLAVHEPWPPRSTGEGYGVERVYPNLHLGCYAGMRYTALDPDLDRALKKLINEALSPLAELDAASGSLKPQRSSDGGKYPPQSPDQGMPLSEAVE